jgi:hypothetical protein
MANNSEVLGEEAALRQLLTNDFSATDGYFEDSDATTVRNYGFYGRTGIKRLILPNVTHIMGTAFRECANLIELNLHSLETFSGNQFFHSTKMECLVFPKISQAIETNMFTYWRGKTLDFGPSLPSIKQYGISNAESCDTIILRRTDGIVTLANSSNVLGGKWQSNGTGGTLYVPSALISEYQTATNWSVFMGYPNNHIEAIEGSQYEHYYADGTPVE